MKHDIIEEAAKIFDTLEKWQAFYEMQQAFPNIIPHWLTIGAEALREEFGKKPSQWKCKAWGAPRDTKWFLGDIGEQSISIGIGWDTFELYLFDARSNSEERQKAADLLKEPDFQHLIDRVGPPYDKGNKDETSGLLLADTAFDPYKTGTESNFRHLFIAWHAANKKGEFVEKTLQAIGLLLEDPTVVRLIRELQTRSTVGSKAA